MLGLCSRALRATASTSSFGATTNVSTARSAFVRQQAFSVTATASFSRSHVFRLDQGQGQGGEQNDAGAASSSSGHVPTPNNDATLADTSRTKVNSQPGRPGQSTDDMKVEWAEKTARTLYVKNFVFGLSEEDLRQAFERYGEVAEVVRTSPSHGWAFIVYKNRDDMLSAQENVDGTFWMGRRIVATERKQRSSTSDKSHPPSRTLFIGNLPYNTTDTELNELFGAVQGLQHVRLATDKGTGWPIGYAHADFLTLEDAVAAKQELDAREVNGRALRIDYAVQKEVKTGLKDKKAVAASKRQKMLEELGETAPKGTSADWNA